MCVLYKSELQWGLYKYQSLKTVLNLTTQLVVCMNKLKNLNIICTRPTRHIYLSNCIQKENVSRESFPHRIWSRCKKAHYHFLKSPKQYFSETYQRNEKSLNNPDVSKVYITQERILSFKTSAPHFGKLPAVASFLWILFLFSTKKQSSFAY